MTESTMGPVTGPVRAVTATAPGKIILMGEYAVLRGAPAVVLAVDRRARVRVRHRISGEQPPQSTVRAPDLGIEAAAWHLSGHGTVRWAADPAVASRLGLVTSVLGGLTRHPAAGARGPEAWPALEIDLDTAEFFAGAAGRTPSPPWHPSTGRGASAPQPSGGKLGLGSSAALTVALAAATAAAVGLAEPSLDRLVAMHRGFQGGRGSGFDIAAARYGGVQVYTDPSGGAAPGSGGAAGPSSRPVDLPPEVSWLAVFSGRSGATAPLLAQVAAWGQQRPRERDRLFERMGQEAERGAAAAVAGSAADLLAALGRYGELMVELGRRIGVHIVGPEHTRLVELAGDVGVVYKGCGAGGGDLGVALGIEPSALGEFRRRAEGLGYLIPSVTLARDGLTMAVAPAVGPAVGPAVDP